MRNRAWVLGSDSYVFVLWDMPIFSGTRDQNLPVTRGLYEQGFSASDIKIWDH